MAELDIRIVFGHLVDDFAPQHGHFQYVGLVNTAQTSAAFLRQLKGHLGDPADLRFVVNVGVVTFALTIVELANAAWLTEVNTARQLTYNQYIQAGNQLWLQRRRIG